MTDGFVFKLLEFTDEEFEKTSRLLLNVFPKSRHLTPAYLRWQYLDNPDGRAVGCNAYLGADLVGHMAAVPMKGKLEGEVQFGLFMLNGAVHVAHRGQKLQSRISAALFEDAAARKLVFIFGTGNKYSTGPLLTRFSLIKPLDAHLGFGLPRRREDDVDPSFVRIWESDAIRWRLSNPAGRYGVTHREDQTVITAPSGIPGIGAVMYDAQRLPIEAAPATGAAAHVWIGLDPRIDWSRSAYARIPGSLRPSLLNLVFRDLSGGGYSPDPAKVVFRALDFDPY